MSERKPSFAKSNERRIRAKQVIPGGAHTYSKGDDQFPAESPHSIVRGKGARIWDVDGNEFVDWGMGLTSVILGHAYDPVVQAVRDELSNGVNFSRPSYLEVELAERLRDLIPCAEMVKFSKNGSDATSAAVRLARACTGRNLVLRCQDQPFFSIHDWFIGDTAVNAGIPEAIQKLTRRFKFNDAAGFETVVEQHRADGIACVILQPADTVAPAPGFLEKVREVCTRHGIVLIFDEVVTGFRWHASGAQALYGVTPDLAAFGKAMANGFSISALAGKRALMERGGLEHDRERVFLMSTTYGGETHHLRAAMATIDELTRDDSAAVRKIWEAGRRLKEGFNSIAGELGIAERAILGGIDCKPILAFRNEKGEASYELRTLFLQEMIREGVLILGISPSLSHGESELDQTLAAARKALGVVRRAIDQGSVEGLLVGPVAKPVFRKFN